ncbi:MAG: 4'-phosphopantetheinyl transferase superfamily protein [Methylococcales bacterium]|nr:4'-phosphopantetheinyl transferase superfamily protein [Methylococcales bacterium]
MKEVVKSNFVDLWYGEFLLKDTEDKDYWALLNQCEKKKAATFSRKDLQQKYIKTRGIVRIILASYLNSDPKKIIIKTGEYGKPFVLDEEIYFNLSHTGNKLVIVVSNCTNVGVDIEKCRFRKSLPALVEKCFSDTEISYWNALPEKQKTHMFFRFWVRKEAFVKAIGRGIAVGLNQCVINPDNQNYFSYIPIDYGFALDWKIIDVLLDENAACAIVTKNLEFIFNQKLI